MKKREGKARKLKRRYLILLGIFFFFVLLFAGYEFLLLPQIHLKGKRNIVLNYKQAYKEKGFSATFLGKDVTKEVKVSGTVKEKKLGTYHITYQVKKGILRKKVVRTIRVKDIEKPVMNLTDEDIYICPGDEFVPEKVEVKDNYDKDLSDKINHTINKDNTKVTYSVTDSSGNKAEITKNIFYKDIEKPEMTLNRGERLNVYIGETFTDPGVTVTDNCDKEIETKVKTTGSVDMNTLGEYKLHYEVEDNYGNKTELDRTVEVKKKAGIIYLTFDDGPNSGTTNVILDILKEEKVPATFFVTGFGPDELIKREYDEGHTVALHTNVHDYAQVYASVDAYFADLSAVSERVKRITGVESKIIRFPGGSSNTVSRHYATGIMSTLVEEVQKRGYRYYDWNISSGDAGNTTLASGVYSNVVNSLSKERSNMVLMHDVKTYTRDALRDIIRYGKENGYTFEKITMDTPMVTQRVNN